MSEEHISFIGNAADIETCAVAWVRRRRFGSWNEKEQSDLEEWLAASLANRVAYWRMNAGYDRIGMLTALCRPASEQAPKQRPLRFATGALGIIAALFLALSAIFAFLPQSTKIYATPIGGHRTLVLPEGSKVELDTDTVLRTKIAASGTRSIWLDKGAAYFQVKHDAARPFVVIVAGHRVTDLGTKFLIRNSNDRLEVALVEGRARVDESGQLQNRSVVLTPGDVAVATSRSMSVVRTTSKELASALSWRSGVLVFKHTALADAAAELNRYNEQKIVILDPSVGRLTIDGTFPVTGVSLFARSAQEVFELHVEKRGNEIAVSR